MPTLLVEGEDDALIYRWLENQLGIFAGSILICSGRDVLVSIYRQRASLPQGKIAWLADRDMWLFPRRRPTSRESSSPPATASKTTCTPGPKSSRYSSPPSEASIPSCYSLSAAGLPSRFSNIRPDGMRHVDHHVKRVVDFAAMDLDAVFCARRGYLEPDASFCGSILANYKLQLRGKTLLQSLVHYLSDARRNPKYSYASILELCLKLYPANPHVGRIIAEAKAQLA